jgi:hypothetical protein
MTILEKAIEKEFRKRCLEHGWKPIKFKDLSQVGAPDRLVLTPGGVFFAEIKRPGEKPSPAQKKYHSTIIAYGIEVYLFDSLEHVETFFKYNSVYWM